MCVFQNSKIAAFGGLVFLPPGSALNRSLALRSEGGSTQISAAKAAQLGLIPMLDLPCRLLSATIPYVPKSKSWANDIGISGTSF